MTNYPALISRNEQNMIQKMELTLKTNGIPPYYFHLGGYAEECVCLERRNNGWEVYVGERGSHFDTTGYDELLLACIEVFDRLADSDSQFQKMLREYRYSLRRESARGKSAESHISAP